LKRPLESSIEISSGPDSDDDSDLKPRSQSRKKALKLSAISHFEDSGEDDVVDLTSDVEDTDNSHLIGQTHMTPTVERNSTQTIDQPPSIHRNPSNETTPLTAYFNLQHKRTLEPNPFPSISIPYTHPANTQQAPQNSFRGVDEENRLKDTLVHPEESATFNVNGTDSGPTMSYLASNKWVPSHRSSERDSDRLKRISNENTRPSTSLEVENPFINASQRSGNNMNSFC